MHLREWPRQRATRAGCQQNPDRIAWVRSDCGSEWTLDWIRSDRIGLVFPLLVQKNYFDKSCFYATGGRNKKSEFSQQESNL